MANAATDDYLAFIDISHNQSTLDGSAAKAAGLAGVICRTSDGAAADRRFLTFITEGARAGLLLGVYHFIRPLSSDGNQTNPTDQARSFLRIAKQGADAIGRPYDLPLMGDVETYWVFKHVTLTPLPGGVFATWLKEFFGVVRGEGGDLVGPGAAAPNIYTNLNFWSAHVAGSPDFGGHGFVSARFVGKTTPPADARQWRDFAFRTTPSVPDLLPSFDRWDGWQFSAEGNRGAHQVGVDIGIRVPGPGDTTQPPDIDCDLFLASSIARWTGGKVVPHPPPPPPTFDSTEHIVNQLPEIRPGATGDHVKRMQALLAIAGFDPGALDGKYTTSPTSPTLQAVKAFQRAHQLNDDGNVGLRQTWPALLGL